MKVCWSGHVEISICMSQTKPIERIEHVSDKFRTRKVTDLSVTEQKPVRN